MTVGRKKGNIDLVQRIYMVTEELDNYIQYVADLEAENQSRNVSKSEIVRMIFSEHKDMND